MYGEWDSACDFVVFSGVEVCVDHGGVNVFYVCPNFCGVYGIGVCVNVCVVWFLHLGVFVVLFLFLYFIGPFQGIMRKGCTLI